MRYLLLAVMGVVYGSSFAGIDLIPKVPPPTQVAAVDIPRDVPPKAPSTPTTEGLDQRRHFSSMASRNFNNEPLLLALPFKRNLSFVFRSKSLLVERLPATTLAAAMVAVVMYPVDIIRALKMAEVSKQAKSVVELVKDFHRAHGINGLIKQGMGPDMCRVISSQVIKFIAQPEAHKHVFGKDASEGTMVTKGISGALAGIPEVVVITPFEILKLALQLDKDKRFKDSISVFKHMYKTRGLPGLYTGYTGVQMRQMLWNSAFFGTLDVLKKPAEAALGKGNAANSLAGLGAGAIGAIFNCGLDVIRTGIQKQAITETFNSAIPRPQFGPEYIASGISSVNNQMALIVKNGGFRNLFRGLRVKLLHMGGTGAMLAVMMPLVQKNWSNYLAKQRESLEV